MSRAQRVGWRLALEPMGDYVAWSLFKRVRGSDGPGAAELVAAEIIRSTDAVGLTVAALAPAGTTAGHGSADPWACDLVHPEAERASAVLLGQALIPGVLREELLRPRPGVEHLVTIASRGWLSAVPWDAVALDERGDVRLVERAQVMGGLSPALFANHHRRPRPSSIRRLAVIDPGPVGLAGQPDPLYPTGYPSAFEERELDGRLDQLAPGWDPLSSDDFGALLRQPPQWASLCYLGHVRPGPASTAGAAGLVFQRNGLSDVLTARQWIAEPDRWPAPQRVALIGCGSDDSVMVEQTGLPIAAMKAGAEFLISTRWTLPTDRVPGLAMGTTELTGVVIDALQAERPEAALRAWQLEKLNRWRARGEPDFSPVLWAAVVCYQAPGPRSNEEGRG